MSSIPPRTAAWTAPPRRKKKKTRRTPPPRRTPLSSRTRLDAAAPGTDPTPALLIIEAGQAPGVLALAMDGHLSVCLSVSLSLSLMPSPSLLLPSHSPFTQTNLSAGTDALLALEKTGRLAEDGPSTIIAVTALLDLLRGAGAWPQLNETILLLSKRRGQLKAVVQAFVRQGAGFVDAVPDAAAQAELMKTLLAVTEGRIYVEIDRARLTRRLAAAKEAAGDAEGAGELLQEVAVETFGAMAKSEKIDFILEQVRLCLDRGDYVR